MHQSITGHLRTDGGEHDGLSEMVERFGLGAALVMLLGAVGGVAAAWALGDVGAVAIMIGLGVGFILSPIGGLLLLRR
jgi:hypothetical protein